MKFTLLLPRYRNVVATGVFGLTLSVLHSPLSAAEDKQFPNIVFYFADDLGWGDNQVNNPQSHIPTPNLNKLAAEGINFTDAHSSGSTCAPSRYGLLTGRNPIAYPNYQYKLTSNAWDCLTLPEMLRKKGYTTHMIGKWHFSVHFKSAKKEGYEFFPRKANPKAVVGKFDLASESKYGPLDRGFDTFFGTPLQPGGGWRCNMEGRKLIGKPHINEKGQPEVEDFDIVKWLDLLTTKSVEKIKQCAGQKKPFFLYIPINSPHKPIVPDEPYRGKTVIGDYGDYCYQVDASLGKVMAALDEAGVADNTILIFSSDNGSFAPAEPKLQSVTKGDNKKPHAANGPWRGAKKDLWEGGHRVPYVVRWPKRVKPGTSSNHVVSLMDHMATFAAIADYKLASIDATDSYNILPLWLGKEASLELRDRVIYHYGPKSYAVRKGKWKAIFQDGKNLLYDLEKDPSESKDLSGERPDVIKEFKSYLDDYKKVKKSAPHTAK